MARRFLIVAGLVVGLLAVALLLVNIYLQSSSVQERIRAAAARVLGGPVSVRSTIFTPWSGLALKGIAMPDPQSPDLNVVQASALEIRFAWWPLLRRQFVVTDVTLSKPDLRLRKAKDGAWLLLPAPVPQEPPAEVELSPGPAAAPARPGFTVHVQRIRIRGGRAMLFDSGNRPVVAFTDVGFDARMEKDGSARGSFAVAAVDVAGIIKPKSLAGDFTWNGSELDLPEISGTLGGGKIKGKYRLALADNPQFSLQLSFDQAQLKKLVEEAGFASESAEGYARGQATVGGDPKSLPSIDGNGTVELIGAKMQPLDFIQKVGQILQIDELQLLKLKDARAEFRIRGDRVNFRNITLKSENLILSGKGPIRFDGRLNMDASLLVNEKIQQQLKGLGVRSKSFADSEVPGYRQLPFEITGSLGSPKTDLLDKLIGQSIGQDMGDFFRGLFQPPKEEPRESPQKNP